MRKFRAEFQPIPGTTATRAVGRRRAFGWGQTELLPGERNFQLNFGPELSALTMGLPTSPNGRTSKYEVATRMQQLTGFLTSLNTATITPTSQEGNFNLTAGKTEYEWAPVMVTAYMRQGNTAEAEAARLLPGAEVTVKLGSIIVSNAHYEAEGAWPAEGTVNIFLARYPKGQVPEDVATNAPLFPNHYN
jgi:hypothetical protein